MKPKKRADKVLSMKFLIVVQVVELGGHRKKENQWLAILYGSSVGILCCYVLVTYNLS